MIANGLRHASVTGGTGALTLTAVTGYPVWADVLGTSGVRLVQYTITQFTTTAQTVIAKFEIGWGDLDLSTLILTRRKVVATWDGTSYVTAAPTALSFVTTAGLVTVTCDPTAELPPLAVPAANISLGDGLGNLTSHNTTANTIYTPTAGTEYYVPYLHHQTGEIVAAGLYVTTATAGGAKLGMYEVGTDGLPGQRLVDLTAGAVVDTGTLGARTTTVSPAYLAPGWYYAAVLFSVAAPVRGNGPITRFSPLGMANTAGRGNNRCSFTGSYATGLPATRAGSAVTANGAVSSPAVFLRTRN